MSGIIDGKAWLENRLAHLQTQLQDPGLGDDERKVLEAESAELKAELASSRRRFRRFIFWGGRPTGM
jgi:hypothetical protein